MSLNFKFSANPPVCRIQGSPSEISLSPARTHARKQGDEMNKRWHKTDFTVKISLHDFGFFDKIDQWESVLFCISLNITLLKG